MKVLILAVVMLFVSVPAYAEENRGVLKGAGAELVLLYGEILHTDCKYGDMITARCNFVVRVQGNTAASKSIYHCEFVNRDGVKDIDITCYTKGLDDPD